MYIKEKEKLLWDCVLLLLFDALTPKYWLIQLQHLLSLADLEMDVEFALNLHNDFYTSAYTYIRVNHK